MTENSGNGPKEKGIPSLKTNECPLKVDGFQSMYFLLKGCPFFRGHETCVSFLGCTFPESNSESKPENRHFAAPKLKDDCLPTNHFHGQAVSFREGYGIRMFPQQIARWFSLHLKSRWCSSDGMVETR